MTYYVAGPMRGYAHFNFDAFDAAAAKLRAEGHVVVSPAEMDRLYEGWGKYPPAELVADAAFTARCLRRDLAAMFDMPHGGIYLLKGWRQSAGAKAELALAHCLGFRVHDQELGVVFGVEVAA